MEAATPLNLAQVRFIGDRMIVDGLQVTDDCALRLAHEADDPVSMLLDAIEIGARILEREHTGADIEVIRHELEKTSAEVSHALSATTDKVNGEMVAKLVELFGSGESPGAVPQRIDQIVGKSMGSAREEIVRFLTSDASPLVQIGRANAEVDRERHEQSQREFKSLREELARVQLQLERAKAEGEKNVAVAAEAEKGTAKGRTYEEAVFEALDAIAVAQGDDCEAVGDVTEGSGKKGDVLVAIEAGRGPARGRIVFEAKNSRLSRPEAMRYLDHAKDQRNADFAVLVVPTEEKIPAQMSALREYNGDKLIVAFDPEEGFELPLQVAYSLARARVLMSKGASEDIDGDAVGDAAQRALQAMEDVRRVKQNLTASKTSIDKAGEIVDEMAKNVRGQLAEIQRLLTI